MTFFLRLFPYCFCFSFLLLLLLFASAFASADYLLCIDTATQLDDKTFTLSFDTQLHQSRNEAAQRCLYLICIAGEALRPPLHPLPHPLPLFNSSHYRPPPLLFPIPLSLGPPRYESYHSYHNYYFLCVDSTTKGGFLLSLAQRNPKPLKPKDNRKEVPIIVPLSSFLTPTSPSLSGMPFPEERPKKP